MLSLLVPHSFVAVSDIANKELDCMICWDALAEKIKLQKFLGNGIFSFPNSPAVVCYLPLRKQEVSRNFELTLSLPRKTADFLYD